MLAIAVIVGLLSSRVSAYDDEVDYTAPYVTVDPETGKLVTVDPKQGTVTPHGATPADSAAAQDPADAAGTAPEERNGSLRTTAAVSVLVVVVVGGAIFLRKSRRTASKGKLNRDPV